MNRTIRDVRIPPPILRRYRAERLLRQGFPALRSKVLAVVRSQLRAKGVSLDRADLEACYAQAWHGLYATVLAGEQVENPTAWLVLATFRRAIDEARSDARVTAKAEAVGETGMAAARGDLAGELDDRTRLREVFEAMRSRLSARECEAASLCYLQGLSRSEAAARMGIGDARMRKLMEGPGGGRPGVAGKVGALLATIQAGDWCEQQSSLMRAYAFGILDPDGERHALAVAHTRDCPSCRAQVAALRGLASVLPPLTLTLGTGTGRHEGTGRHAGTGHVAGAGTRARAGVRGGRPARAWLAGGSLSAKLTVGVVLVLGTGATILGLRSTAPSAHGLSGAHQSGGRAGVRVPAAGIHTRLRLLAPVRPRGARHARRAGARAGSRALHPPTLEAPASEFSPERAGGETLAPPPTTPTPTGPSRSSPSTSAGAGGEFGIE